MQFQTQYTHKSSPPENNSGKTLVERAGYISAQKRIENMILAGQRLVDYRKSQFDFEGDKIDFDFDDPTRNPNFDMADASQLKYQAEANLAANRIARAKKAELDKEALKASQTAQEAQNKLTEQKKGV